MKYYWRSAPQWAQWAAIDAFSGEILEPNGTEGIGGVGAC